MILHWAMGNRLHREETERAYESSRVIEIVAGCQHEHRAALSSRWPFHIPPDYPRSSTVLSWDSSEDMSL